MDLGSYSARLNKGDTVEFSKPGKRISLRQNPVQPGDTIVTKSSVQRGGSKKVNFVSINSSEAPNTVSRIIDAGYLDGPEAESMTSAQYAAAGGAAKKKATKAKQAKQAKPEKKTTDKKKTTEKRSHPRPAAEQVMPASTPVTAGNIEKALERFGSARLKTRTSKSGEYRVAEVYRNGKAKVYDVRVVDAGPDLYKELSREGFSFDPTYGDWLAHINDHLSAAVRDGRTAEVMKLLENGGNVNNVVYDSGGTPLSSLIHTAIRAQNLDVIRTLLNNGADPNSHLSRNKRTPLIYAVLFSGKDNKADIKRSVQIIQLLLSKGADPKAKDDKHKSALEYANNISYFQKIHDFKKALEGKSREE
jgi:hypothetical protein